MPSAQRCHVGPSFECIADTASRTRASPHGPHFPRDDTGVPGVLATLQSLQRR